MAIFQKGDIITSPQTLTGSWADIGSEIECFNYSFFSTYIKVDINDSEDVRFRFKGLYESGGDEYDIPLKIIKKDKVLLDDLYYELNNDTDQDFILQTEIDQNLTLIKLQTQAGTVGAAAGSILDVKYIQGYRQ